MVYPYSSAILWDRLEEEYNRHAIFINSMFSLALNLRVNEFYKKQIKDYFKKKVKIYVVRTSLRRLAMEAAARTTSVLVTPLTPDRDEWRASETDMVECLSCPAMHCYNKAQSRMSRVTLNRAFSLKLLWRHYIIRLFLAGLTNKMESDRWSLVFYWHDSDEWSLLKSKVP